MMMTARIAVATALSSAISSSVVRGLNGCLVRGLICFPEPSKPWSVPMPPMSTRGDLHKKSRSGITPRGSYKRLPFPVPPLPSNR
jgi:hypothetical protein